MTALTDSQWLTICRYIERVGFGDDGKVRGDTDIRECLKANWRIYNANLRGCLFTDGSGHFAYIDYEERPAAEIMYIWHDREGRSYQKIVESHVAAYRRTPRRFDQDIALCHEVVLPMLNEKGVGCGMRFGSQLMKVLGIERGSLTPGIAVCICAAKPADIALAAFLALGGVLECGE